jgi:fatty acid desaturase
MVTNALVPMVPKHTSGVSTRSSTRLAVATVDPEQTVKQSVKKASLDVRIDDVWYDLSGWRKAHPAGDHWIDMYQGRDATEVMHAFHSDKARNMFQKLPKSKDVETLDANAAPVTSLTRNFRALKAQLEEEGWWKRDYVHEAKLLGMWAACLVSGIFFAKTIPVLAVFLLSLANTSAGWIGHDYIHGVDKFSFAMRNFACIAAGMSPTWWSDKHNKHHAVPNEVGVDEDLATEPLLFVYPPNPEKDVPIRKFQHWYVAFPFSLLFSVWRFDSMKLCIKDAMNGFKRKTQQETLMQLIHYTVMLSLLPLPVFGGMIFLSGLMTAIIVTVTHQSEVRRVQFYPHMHTHKHIHACMHTYLLTFLLTSLLTYASLTFHDVVTQDLFYEHNPDFVDSQFRSTRNAKCINAFTNWLWGGMQWQLEHHLFPSMPRSKYPALSKVRGVGMYMCSF